MVTPNTIVSSNALAADATSLNGLKFKAGQDSKAAIKEAAKQFESLFMRELIKSMREATMKSGLMDEDQGTALGNDLLDQQMSVHMSGLPGGLSAAIERQLAKQMDPNAPTSMPAPRPSGQIGPVSSSNAQPQAAATTYKPTVTQTEFVSRLGGSATRVAQESGIPASFMLGQAGHEPGWGKSESKNADGSTSFNLFGIKAGKGWMGKVAEITTTEYVNGAAQKVTAKFRAYDSYEDSFKDYARLINNSPRYEQARAKVDSATAYATELQKAGYATDPDYASKLSGAINSALRVQRAAQA
jgi:flagellar protein FlgJ